MFLVFLNVEYYSPCDCHLGQQVEISKNEEDFALRFILELHVFLIRKQLVIELFCVDLALLLLLLLIVLLHLVLVTMLAVAKREHVEVNLEHKYREVKLSKLEVDVLQVIDLCLALDFLWITDLLSS
jgi:hypothetical protein